MAYDEHYALAAARGPDSVSEGCTGTSISSSYSTARSPHAGGTLLQMERKASMHRGWHRQNGLRLGFSRHRSCPKQEMALTSR